MKRFLMILCLVAVANATAGLSAFGSILPATLTGGTLNTYEDQSRESIIDVDGDGALSVGDVLIGFLRIDDKVAPNGVSIPDDDLYAVFTSELVSQTVVDVGPLTLYLQTFAPTTVPGLTLTDLFPSLVPFLALSPVGSTPAVAIFEEVGTNLITTPPGDFNGDGSLDMLDYLDRIALGATSELDAIAGFDPAAPNPDIWTGRALVPDAPLDPIADLSLLDSLLTGSPVGATFDVGLSPLYLDPSMPNLSRLVPVSNNVTGAVSLHDIGVTNGNTSGASDAVGFGYFSNGFSRGGATWDAADVYAIADNANVSVFPVVPEPASLLVWGLLVAVGAGLAARRSA